MGSAGWDEVLGGGDGGDESRLPDDGHDGGGDGEGDEPVAKKKRIKTSTKIVLVVGAWLLLTLFLVGQFSSEKPHPSAVARLDTVSGEDATLAEGEEELFEPEPVDTEEEELLDADGDGFLSAEEQGITEGEAAASAESAGEAGSGSGAYVGTPGAATGGEGGTGGNAVPGAPPGGGSATTTGGSATTTTSGGGGGGGASTSTTATTKQGGGGTTTTTSASTTTTTAGNPPPLSKKEISITGNSAVTYTYNERTFSIPAGTTVKLSNPTTKDHTWKIEDRADVDVKEGEFVERTFSTPGTYDFHCTKSGHVNMTGTITVT